MNAIELIERAKSEGLILNLMPNGKINARGEIEALQKWAFHIKQQRNEIISALDWNKEFEVLLSHISNQAKWDKSDCNAWREDFKKTPVAVLECLRALRLSWDSGRYGWIIETDWSHQPRRLNIS